MFANLSDLSSLVLAGTCLVGCVYCVGWMIFFYLNPSAATKRVRPFRFPKVNITVDWN